MEKEKEFTDLNADYIKKEEDLETSLNSLPKREKNHAKVNKNTLNSRSKNNDILIFLPGLL